MGKSVWKDLFREIKRTFGRFIAIFAIVAIGVAFFAGVTASSNDMKNSTDHYYDDYNMSDLRLLSSLGFNEDDIKAIRAVDGGKGVYPAYSQDAVIRKDSIETAVHIMSVPDNTDRNNENYINQLRIKEGRLPEKSGECVVRYEDTRDNFSIGDTIKLSSGTQDDINDSLKDSEYTVVGTVYTPYYVSYDLGTTNVGSGRINYLMYITEDEFMSDYFNEMFVTVDGAKELDTYGTEYKDLIKETADKIDNISQSRINVRKDDIQDVYEASVNEAKEAAKKVIYDHVVESLTEQYSNYFVGMDVSAIIEPYIQPAYEKALADYDFSSIEAQAKEDFESKYGDSDDWKWYELTRQEQYSFKDYESSADRMKAIATVFPIFFIVVSALVCLTTMTRMVEEERGLIGTYKALGYSKKVIAFKYIAYALIASVTGGIAGCIIGLKLFPLVIYDSWNIIYQLPPIVYDSHILLSIIAITSMILVTVIAAIFSCYSELEEVPSELMRPKAPKSGKKILLEHITFIWKHLNFSNKAAVRNLFRYKKRLFMTVLGIGGCMGLLLVGFGVKDSIMTIGDRQYNFIHTYQVKMTLADADTDEEKQEVLDSVLKESTTKAAMLSHESTIDACCGANGEKKQSTYLFIPSDADELDEFVSLQNRISGQKYTLDDEGVIISEKLATLLDVSEGDDIYLEVSSLNYKPVKVMHIAENYYYHYVYMTPECYQSLFGKDIEYDEIFVVNKDPEDISYENDFSAKYLDNNAVSGITFTRTISDRIESMITSMNIVTYVLVVSAGLLAFIVLYNLNNINISERQRELATLKVLGFYDGEISMYVFRENIMLTVLGTIFGIFFGIWLHRFVILTAELDIMMFGRQIYTKSYIYSILLTIGFSIIVNIVMHWKMKKIDMIESLKSVE